jgi:hypothetical protein
VALQNFDAQAMIWKITAAVISEAPFLDLQLYLTACLASRAQRLKPPGKMTAI